ncbi:MAG: hypothetical protein ACFNZS_13255, partial [Ottowia sp.]
LHFAPSFIAIRPSADCANALFHGLNLLLLLMQTMPDHARQRPLPVFRPPCGETIAALPAFSFKP